MITFGIHTCTRTCNNNQNQGNEHVYVITKSFLMLLYNYSLPSSLICPLQLTSDLLSGPIVFIFRNLAKWNQVCTYLCLDPFPQAKDFEIHPY